MKISIVLIMCFILSGCGIALYSVQKDNTAIRGINHGSTFYKNYAIEITSEPSGAKIEFNEGYIGTTPLTYILHGGVELGQMTTIKALPISGGQYVQKKVFMSNEVIPRQIYFDMNLVPQEPTVNVNVNNQ